MGTSFSNEALSNERAEILAQVTEANAAGLGDAFLSHPHWDFNGIRIGPEVEKMEENPFFDGEAQRPLPPPISRLNSVRK